MKNFKMKMLVSSITVSMLMPSIAFAGTDQIGDLEIYKAADGTGGGTIMMMLDVSGSMYNSVDEGCSGGQVTSYQADAPRIQITDPNGQPYPVSKFKGTKYPDGYITVGSYGGCKVNGKLRLNRISRLKQALVELFADGTSFGEQYSMGVGIYPPNSDNPGYGYVMAAAKPLTFDQRIILLNKINSLDAGGFTPMAVALADAGAYMMGTTTAGENKGGFRIRAEGYTNAVDNQQRGYIKDVVDIAGGHYISPVKAGASSECGGYGIYLLTDGQPNRSSNKYASEAMARSLNNTPPYTPAGDPSFECKTDDFQRGAFDISGYDAVSGWQCIGTYAKKLNSTNNPLGTPIKVATVGFGDVFTSNLANTIKIQTPKGEREIQDCSVLTSDAYNLCKLGELKGTYTKPDGTVVTTGGYGEGGFVATAEPEAIKQSLTNFAAEITQIINTTPSGTITVPNDPLSVGSLQPYAYLPMLEPKVGDSSIIWPGNLKRYSIKNATLYGKDNKRLYKAETKNGFPYLLNGDAKDLWMDSNGNASEIHQGGVYAKLKAPNQTTKYSVRNVWVEDVVNNKPKLVKVGVDSNGKLVGFNDLKDAVYTPVAKAYLLNFLGYDVSVDATTYSATADVTKKLEDQITPPNQPIKVLGGVVHSKPTLVSYGGSFIAQNSTIKDENGNDIPDPNAGLISQKDSDRKDYVMFGSMDGALHLVKAKEGEEVVAVIPKAILQRQLSALKEGSTHAQIGKPMFGVDAPWMSKGNYILDLGGNGSVKAEKMYAYGGLRMGGEGVYGLDLTNKEAPSLMFSIERGKGGAFKRLGQTWKEPLLAKIKTGASADDTREVLIFGGGYDMCYESPTFTLATTGSSETDVCANKTAAYGNAVYMVDAKTGEKIWSWNGKDSDGDSKESIIPEMKHSIVGGITVLDRNDNGTIDHLYFADLGGQVFRVDLQEGKTGLAMTKRTVKIFDANKDVKTKEEKAVKNHIAFRFYEQPIVSFYDNDQERFAVVNIASGDRSSPLYKGRSIEDANRVYGIMDRDIAQQNLYGTQFKQITQNLGNDDLVRLPFDNSSATTSRVAVVASMQSGSKGTGDKAGRLVYSKQGWYYPLTRFDGFEGIKHVKSMGEGRVVGSIYYMTTYTPLMNYGSADSCSAKIEGGSERQLYCMPYGVCNSKNPDGSYRSSNGTGGFTRAGPGIQELVLGPISDTQRNTSTLLGTQTLTELVKTNDRINSGQGMPENDVNKLDVTPGVDGVTKDNADGTAPQIFHSESFRLLPKRWYELQNNE